MNLHMIQLQESINPFLFLALIKWGKNENVCAQPLMF